MWNRALNALVQLQFRTYYFYSKERHGIAINRKGLRGRLIILPGSSEAEQRIEIAQRYFLWQVCDPVEMLSHLPNKRITVR